MLRKQLHGQKPNGATMATSGDAPPSPSTGAMDLLMEKLRAAAPQTRDTRDRRRRARLKDRHQVRVASGQKIPETGENVGENVGETVDESGLLTPAKTNDSDEPTSIEGGISEGEDIADRAASMLQGLRGDEDGEGPGRDDSIRVRRRRESANDERAQRRARRRGAGTSTDTNAHSIITEEGESAESKPQEDGDKDDGSQRDSDETQLPTPTTVVVPPSPTASESKRTSEE